MVQKSHMLVGKLHSGTSKTKQLVPVHLDLPVLEASLWCVILYHVTGLCKGIPNTWDTPAKTQWGGAGEGKVKIKSSPVTKCWTPLDRTSQSSLNLVH